MMSGLEISEMATAGDVEVVRGLLQAYVDGLFAAYPGQLADLTAYYGPARLKEALDGMEAEYMPPAGLVLIARLEGRPVGCVFGHPIAPGVAELKRLFVMPGLRGHGIGRTLILTLTERMAGWGLPVIRLDTTRFLREAISLYRSLGFVEIAPYATLPAGTEGTAIFMEWRPETSVLGGLVGQTVPR
jgi:GNAT superfamily N-acetyltransferase